MHATVYELEALRCNLCGEEFTPPPPGVGADKYDATAASMIALLKYGSGLPFHRMERLESHVGIPLPAATQWQIVAETATRLEPVWEALIRQAAQGHLLHNHDTSMRILRFRREASDARTGLFTSGIVSLWQQFDERNVEPNPGLGKAIQDLRRHWRGLTPFLRQAGAPLDNNIL